jgi:hypothetical protein
LHRAAHLRQTRGSGAIACPSLGGQRAGHGSRSMAGSLPVTVFLV